METNEASVLNIYAMTRGKETLQFNEMHDRRFINRSCVSKNNNSALESAPADSITNKDEKLSMNNINAQELGKRDKESYISELVITAEILMNNEVNFYLNYFWIIHLKYQFENFCILEL